jgi:hypothetical protein
MKDILAFILFYLVWNSPVHEQHPTMIPVLFTVYICLIVIELIIDFLKKK